MSDTHALVWHLALDARLSQMARKTFTDAAQRGEQIGVPSICLVEMVYLAEKGGIAQAQLNDLKRELASPQSLLLLVPLDADIAWNVQKVDRAMVPELLDRIIVATAKHLGVPLITRDQRIQAEGIQTIW